MKPYYVTLLLCAGLLTGCASNSSVDVIRQDLQETKNKIHNLTKDVSTAREGEKNLKSEFTALRKADADLSTLLDAAKADMQVLTAKQDDMGQSQRRTADELKRYREDTDRRMVAIEDRIVKLQAALDELNKRLREGQTAAAPQEGGRPDALYLKGLESFKANDMPSARVNLTQFVEQHPSHDLVANARYWIGETYYSEKNYEQAILEFQEVIKLYPKKEKAPAAMLKQALAFKALKDVKSTRYVLNRLAQEYPKTDEARKARALLKELK